MLGTQVNPTAVKKGDKLATKHRLNADGSIQVIKTRDVKRVEFCPGKPELFHIDGECYDTRFSTVVIANDE